MLLNLPLLVAGALSFGIQVQALIQNDTENYGHGRHNSYGIQDHDYYDDNHHHNHLFKREEGQIVCSSYSGLLARSTAELKQMIPRALASLDRVNNYLSSCCDTKADGATWAAVQYFEVIFGGPLSVRTRGQAAAKARVAYVREKLTLINNVLTSGAPYPFNLYCNDAWLSTLPSDAEAANVGIPGARVDIRPGAIEARAESVAAGEAASWTPLRCGTKTDVMSIANFSPLRAWVLAHPPTFDQPIMTICPAHLDLWTRGYAAGFQLGQLLDRDISQEKIYGRPTGARNHLRAFITRSMATTLMHEMSHVNQIMFPGSTGTSPILDHRAGFSYEGVSCDSGYGWDCITLLARNNQADALKNADTWAYYVLGASLSENNWATGFPEPLLPEP